MSFPNDIDTEEFLSLLSHQEETDGPTASDAVLEIVKAEGDLDLAGERLFGPSPLRPEPGYVPQRSRLISLLAQDPQALIDLQKHLRVLTMLQTYSSARKIGAVVDGLLSSLPSDDLVKLYSSLLTQVATLTDDHTINQNLNANLTVPEAMLGKMPPRVREAMKVLAMEPVNQASLPTPDSGSGPDIEDESLEVSPQRYSLMDPLPNAANGTA